MPELDRLKEELAYLKFWQGLTVVTEISLVGWLISTVDTADRTLWSLALLTVVVLTLGVFALHRQIGRLIDRIGKL